MAHVSDRDESDFRQGWLNTRNRRHKHIQNGIEDPLPRCRTPSVFLDYPTDPWPLESPMLADVTVLSTVEHSNKRKAKVVEPSCPSDVTPRPDDHRPAKLRRSSRRRPSSQPHHGATPAHISNANQALQLVTMQQQAEFLRQDNDALFEQQRHSLRVNNRVVMENQLLRGILWAYVQLKNKPDPRPGASWTD